VLGFLKKAIFGQRLELEPIQVRVQKSYLNEDTDMPFLEIQCKGLFPVYATTEVGFMTSVFTKDMEGDLSPVLSFGDSFQEPETVAFQHLANIGKIDAGQGFTEWAHVGSVPLGLLNPSFGGIQDLTIIVRLVDMYDLPDISLGFGEAGIWRGLVNYKYNFKRKGYEEEAEDIDKSRALSIQIGMSVAMADGELDETEGETLKAWIQKMIAPFGDEKQKKLKKVYNNAMRSSYKLAESGDLVLGNICKQLNEIGEDAQKYEAVELAHEVMAADGIVHSEEMKVIHKVADALGIDADELENMRDQHMIGLNLSSDGSDIESSIGIKPSWSNDKKQKHLRQEYQKWNNRLNTLPEGQDRENAQQKLDLIAKARKKNGG
jgi:tellurite resistance protein